MLPSFPPLPSELPATKPLRPSSKQGLGATIERNLTVSDSALHAPLLGLAPLTDTEGLLRALATELQRSPPHRFVEPGPTPLSRFGNAPLQPRGGYNRGAAAAGYGGSGTSTLQPPLAAARRSVFTGSADLPRPTLRPTSAASRPTSAHAAAMLLQQQQQLLGSPGQSMQVAGQDQSEGEDFGSPGRERRIRWRAEAAMLGLSSKQLVDLDTYCAGFGGAPALDNMSLQMLVMIMGLMASQPEGRRSRPISAATSAQDEDEAPETPLRPARQHAEARTCCPYGVPPMTGSFAESLKDMLAMYARNRVERDAGEDEGAGSSPSRSCSPTRGTLAGFSLSRAATADGARTPSDVEGELDFDELDVDGDGVISRADLEMAMERRRSQARPGPLPEVDKKKRHSRGGRPSISRTATTISQPIPEELDFFGDSVPGLSDEDMLTARLPVWPGRRGSALSSGHKFEKRGTSSILSHSCSTPLENTGSIRTGQSSTLAATLAARRSVPCTKCEDEKKKYEENQRKTFLEIEHVRRGLDKLVEVCSGYMTTTALHQLMDKLQLGVRYITMPDPKDLEQKKLVGRPERPQHGGDSGLVESLKTKIANLEDLVAELKAAHARLKQQLETEKDNRPMPVGCRSSLSPTDISMVKKVDAVTQTKPWEAPHAVAEGDRRQRVGSKEVEEREQADPRRGGPRDPEAKDRKQPRAGAAGGEGGQGGPDDDDWPERFEALQRKFKQLQAEYDLLELKLKAAEKARGSLEARLKELEKQLKGSEDEAAKLRRKLDENQAAVDTLEKNAPAAAAELSARPLPEAPAPTAGKAGGKAAAAGASGQAEVKKRKKGPDIDVAQQKGIQKRAHVHDLGGGAPAGGLDGSTEASGRGEPQEPNEKESQESAAEESEPEMVDKCVGNGPGHYRGDPIRCRGRRAPGLPKEMNSDGRCYARLVRSVPDLASAGESVCGPPQLTKALTSATTLTKAAAGRRWVVDEPEPYLLEVWERQPKGHRAPPERELRVLGALGPPPPRCGSAARLASVSVGGRPGTLPASLAAAVGRPGSSPGLARRSARCGG